MQNIKPFVGQLLRLVLVVAAILAGREIVVRLPMVAELQRLPGIGVSARDLVTAFAYLTVLFLLVSFARNIESVVTSRPGELAWQSLVGHGLIFAGIIFAYGALSSFAASLLGRYYWAYSVALLLLAVVPLVGIGRLLYDFASARIEQWED